jgi:predicted enzyme related to lactoylglutathione lyase
MTEGMKTIIFPVRDLEKAKAFYGELLGVEPTADQPYYVGFDVGNQHIGLNPQGHNDGMAGPVGYWHVDDIRTTLKSLVDTGAKTVQDVKQVGQGRLIASVEDSDGNVVGILQDE